MSRSLKKGPYTFDRLLKRVKKLNESGKKEVIKTWSRRSTIYPSLCPTISSVTYTGINSRPL